MARAKRTMKLFFNPFNIFKPSFVAQRILDGLDKYPLPDWDWSTAYDYYQHPKLSYKIYLSYPCLYAVCGLELGYFDAKRVDSKCKSQIKAAEKLAGHMAQVKVIRQILKS